MATLEKGTDKPENAPLIVLKEGAPSWRDSFSDTLPFGWQTLMISRAIEGDSEHQIYCHLRVTPSCWRKAKRDNKEFQEVFEHCMMITRGWWEDVGQKNLGNMKFNAYLYNIHMINRFAYLAKKKAEEDSAAMNAKLEAMNEEAPAAELDHLFSGEPRTGGARAGTR